MDCRVAADSRDHEGYLWSLVYIDLEGVRKMDKLDGMLQDENGTKDPAVVG
jgi:hypothetical protein